MSASSTSVRATSARATPILSAIWRRIAGIIWELLLPAVLITIWWVWSVRANDLFFPPLPEVLSTFADTWFGNGFTLHVLPSLGNLAVGYFIGVTLGIASGVVLGLARWLHQAATPLLEYARALPPPAVLPFAILVLGVGPQMKIGVIVLGVIFPVLINTIDGVRAVEPTVREMVRVYRLPWHFRLWHVLLPSASPQIITGARTSLSIGVLLMVVSEMVASTEGIGFFTLQAQRTFSFTQMWAGMLLLGLLGYVLNLAFGLAERRILHWQIGAAKAAKETEGGSS